MTVVGVPGERVLLLRADLPDGENVSVGSGTLIGPQLVLTAAHVVFDRVSGRPLARVAAGPPAAARLSAARVVWPDSYRHTEDPAALDVALVQITDPGWEPPIRGVVRWGRLTGRSPGVPCEATGFPRVLRDPDNTRESDQISGTINPGTGSVRGRYDVNVTSTAPSNASDSRQPPWLGASGAGVFAAGLLTAVLVIDTKGFDHRRLTAIPSYRILAQPEVHRILEAHGVGVEMESVELSEILISAGQENQVRRRRGQKVSPATLLRADFETVDFYGREDQLADLTGWCLDPELEVGVRLLTGPGGRGKTRLARQLVAGFRDRRPLVDSGGQQQWVAGFLADRTGAPLARLADTAAPVLLVVDYAETRTMQLAELLPQLWAADCGPVRLLLLARAAGDWWRKLARELGGPLGESTVLTTLDDTTADRQKAFRVAIIGFAAQLSKLALGTEPSRWARSAETSFPADLTDVRYGDPLSLQLAALLSLLDSPESADQASQRGEAEWIDNPERHLLSDHEEKYWVTTSPSWLNLHPDTLAEVVTAATLTGAGNPEEALAVLRGLPALHGQPENALIAISNWLRDLYPASADQEWGSLQPDRVGEHLIASTLNRNPRMLARILTSTSEAQNYQTITVLARALANNTIPRISRTQMAAQLGALFTSSEIGNRLAQVTLQVATETADPVPLINALVHMLGKMHDDSLREFADHFPERSFVLADLAAEVSRHLIDRLRHESVQDQEAQADLARSLNSLGNRLSDLGQWTDALNAAKESVGLYRQLAIVDSAVFTPDLAMALNSLSNRLSELGQREAALDAVEEAADLYRQLTALHPAFALDLAGSLNNMSHHLSELGRFEEALTAAEEGIRFGRWLSAESDAFTANLAMSLSTLSSRYSDMGRWEEAFESVEEATEIYRRLAVARPDAFTSILATTLNNRCAPLFSLGRREEALDSVEEATEIYRRLAAARPDAFTLALATTLNNLSSSLSYMGRRQQALSVIEEAVGLYRQLAAKHPETFVPDVAMSLTTLSNGLSDLGRAGEALLAITEAASLYQELAAARPDAFASDFAMSLHNLSNRLSDLSRAEEALSTIEQATSLYRQLAASRPDVFLPNVAKSLNSLSIRLSDLHRAEEALAAIKEAADIYRRLADAQPDAFTPDFAMSLNTLSNRLSTLGRTREALIAIEEAVKLRRELVAANPDAFTHNLAMSLNNLCERLLKLKRPLDALAAIDEAVGLYRRLAGNEPGAFTRNLAVSLINRSKVLSVLGEEEEARAAAGEAARLSSG